MLDKKHIAYFKKILPKEFVFSEPGDCWAYGYDNSKIHVLPECVLFAENKSQIQNIVIYCNKYLRFIINYSALNETCRLNYI